MPRSFVLFVTTVTFGLLGALGCDLSALHESRARARFAREETREAMLSAVRRADHVARWSSPPAGTPLAMPVTMNSVLVVDGAALVERVRALGGLTRDDEAYRAIRATLSALGQQLSPRERRILHDALPPSLRRGLGVGAPHPLELKDFFHVVHRREGVSEGFAREHAQVVCRALGELVPRELRARLERELPPAVAELLEAPEAPSAPLDYPSPRVEWHHTVARGKPGSRHPVSTSRADRAQRHSVVREDNPHAETKLSSSTGTTQERLHESLATGHPNARRRISEAGD